MRRARRCRSRPCQIPNGEQVSFAPTRPSTFSPRGTTGLPKAANVSHLRTLFMMHGFAGALGARASDRMYDVLPLYHSAGGICAVGVALTCGGSVVLRRKFSVHEFWDDCVRYRPTFFQYIGELCRYLLNAPASAARTRPSSSRHHRQRIEARNLEAVSDAVCNTENHRVLRRHRRQRVDVELRRPRLARWGAFRTTVARDTSRYESSASTSRLKFPSAIRKGFCIECPSGETGEAIGRIVDEPGNGFEGYTHAADTEKRRFCGMSLRGG